MSDWDSPREFISRVSNAILRLVAMAVYGGAHLLLEKCLLYVVPDNFKPVHLWIEDVSFVVFMLVYAYLLWDMLRILIPWLKPRTYPGTEPKK